MRGLVEIKQPHHSCLLNINYYLCKTMKKKERNLMCESMISYTEIGSNNPDRDVTYHVWKWDGMKDLLLHFIDEELAETLTGNMAREKVRQLV